MPEIPSSTSTFPSQHYHVWELTQESEEEAEEEKKIREVPYAFEVFFRIFYSAQTEIEKLSPLLAGQWLWMRGCSSKKNGSRYIDQGEEGYFRNSPNLKYYRDAIARRA